MKKTTIALLFVVLVAAIRAQPNNETVETEAELRARIHDLEIQITIAALKKGLIAVDQCSKNLEAQAKAFGKDPEIMKVVMSNMQWCVTARLEIEQEIERNIKRAQEQKPPASKP